MADSKMAVSQWSPTFVEELLPAARKTALLYHLSYLCLAKFTSLESLIRTRALETQLLFSSSDATMLKCFLTSNDLVTSLFPMLVTAVENTDVDLAVCFLKKAKDWIKDIITDVEKIVEWYELHIKNVGSSTSDVYKEKDDTDKKLKLTEKLKSELQETIKELNEKINSKNQEIQAFVRSITQTSKGLGIFTALIPFFGIVVKSIYDAVKDRGQVAHLKALAAQLNGLIAEKTAQKQKQWKVQLQIMDLQKKAARGSIPDPIYLPEVQSCLSKIQDILIQLKDFWEKVAQLLDSLEQTTIENLVNYKDDFLKSIKMANEAYIDFGADCKKASDMFKLQTKDAYKFLEVSPSSLSEKEWEIEYESVQKQLKELDPPPTSVTSSDTPAISE